MGFTSTAKIDRPVEEVWAFLTDLSRAPEWMGPVERIETVGGAPLGEGVELSFQARGADRRSTIVALRPPREMALESKQGGVTATYTYRCEPDNGGTEVSLHAECAVRGGWKILGPLIRFMMKRVDGKQMAALRDAMGG